MLVFISHKRPEDEERFNSLREKLEGHNIEAWDPGALGAGLSLADKLREAIAECELCVFVVTKSSLDSEWCKAEAGAFWGAGKRVILYLAEEGIDKASLPRQFEGLLLAENEAKVLDSVRQGLEELDYNLTRDLTLILRYFTREDRWVDPVWYGRLARPLALANGAAADIHGDQLKGWRRAVRWGLLYLQHLKLLDRMVHTSVAYRISKKGKRLLHPQSLRKRHPEYFETELVEL